MTTTFMKGVALLRSHHHLGYPADTRLTSMGCIASCFAGIFECIGDTILAIISFIAGVLECIVTTITDVLVCICNFLTCGCCSRWVEETLFRFFHLISDFFPYEPRRHAHADGAVV
ncbi:hypothetical protein L218DRAFT_724349 [Marasmius fiardii PR-910]|nr:hypothetical protein L218DRAFT_724349 [Marasmius fiardii PR-910]